MRELTGHKVGGCNEALRVWAKDDPGPGGACHDYEIYWQEGAGAVEVAIPFQNGPIAEVGVNGVTHESLLIILIDRLEGFQLGPYACHENAVALAHLKVAQKALLNLVCVRLLRGVEGTHTV